MNKIRLLATSDVHGYIPPYSYGTIEEIQSGMARIATLIQSLRDENTLVLGFNHEITMRDIVCTYVFPNALCVVEMKGKDVLLMLEQCAEYFCVENGQLGVAKRFLSPKPAHYKYDMFDGEGVSYTIHANREIGNRVSDVLIKGEKLDLEKEYSVVVNNYRAGGGGNFEMFERAKKLHDLQKDVVECIAQYILEKKIIHVDHHDNIQVVIDQERV